MRLFDTHCHIPHHRYQLTPERVVENAHAAGVMGIVAIGTSVKENDSAIRFADKNDGVYCAVGIHVDEDRGTPIDELKQVLACQRAASGKVVAIGECGMDISEWEGARPRQEQVALFEMQVQLALEYGLPVIIHNRNGDEEILRIVRQYAPQGLRAIAHSFSQPWDYAQALLGMGAYLAFSGMITYKGRRSVLETVKGAPKDRILIETDAPYLPPEGFRGQPNEPKNVVAVAAKIAEVRAETLERVAAQTYENAKTVFGIN